MRKKYSKEYEECMAKITPKVKQIIGVVGKQCAERGNWLSILEEKNYIINRVLPTPLQIAKYYGIRIEYKKIEGDIPSYFKREKLTIYVSNEYRNKRYAPSKLVAHELGHFFLDNSELSAMNDDDINEYLPEEIMKEYRANIFAILLMPQIMGGNSWAYLSPKLLNRKVFKNLIKENI